MAYRAIEMDWQPRSRSQAQAATATRREAARLWADLVERHHRLRRLNWGWPSKARWQVWAKGRYPGLSAQSVQQTIADFCEAVNSARQLRKNGREVRYPWRKSKYYDVVYTNQSARIKNGVLILPAGQSGTLRVRLPDTLTLPGRLMEVRLCFGRILLICEIPDAPQGDGPTIGVDLGVNTIAAATDGEKAIAITGRGAKATIQWRNKRLASLSQRQSRHEKGSRRWRRVQRRKRKLLTKANHRIRDLLHKASRQVADAFPNARCYVGEPFNDAAEKMRARQAQTVNQTCTRKLIRLLDYKTAGAIVVNEAYTSQTCPVCGERSKHGRIYRCRCGVVAPRDVIGATNILAVGKDGQMLPERHVPSQITYRRPWQQGRRSSPGHGGSSS